MQSDNPFVGIQPFKESDAGRFYGRESESDRLIDRIMTYPVTVLTGPSGLGKSSLVNCGVVKPLKDERHDPNAPFKKMPLVIRDWGQVRDSAKGSGISALFAAVLEREYDRAFEPDAAWDAATRKKVKEERESFRRVYAKRAKDLTTDPNAFIALVSELSEVFGGVVLVFDQFEEILREGPATVRDVCNLVTLAAGIAGVRIMLSLRNEHLDALRFIEGQRGPLAQSTIHLTPMSFESAKTAFSEMALQRGVKLESALLERLRPAGATEADLFYFQAILKEVWDELSANGHLPKASDGFVLLDSSALDLAIGNLRTGARGDFEPEAVFQWALFRIIEDSFRVQDETERNRALRHRAHAVRLVQWLSAGGFKNTRREDELFKRTYRDAMANIANLERADQLTDVISGSFRVEHEGAIQSADALIKALKGEYVETLNRLATKMILKRYTTADNDGDDKWELSHDRLGEPLYEWSRRQQNSIGDARNAPLASLGVTPLRVDKHQIVSQDREVPREWRKLSWRGCSIEPGSELTWDGTEAPLGRFRDVVFSECDFRGSVFVRCSFERCNFERCNLSGVAFVECVFSACKFADMDQGNANSVGFLGCEFHDGVVFERCHLIQLSISKSPRGRKVLIDEAGVSFEGGKIYSSRFLDRSDESLGGITFRNVDDANNWFEYRNNLNSVSQSWLIPSPTQAVEPNTQTRPARKRSARTKASIADV